MTYGIMLILSWILVGSGAVGSNAFLIGLLIGLILIAIGVCRLSSETSNEGKEDKDERH